MCTNVCSLKTRLNERFKSSYLKVNKFYMNAFFTYKGFIRSLQTGLYRHLAIICNFRHPGTLTLRTERQSARMSKITNDGLTCCYDSPVFGGQSSDVSERLLHSGHRRQQPTPTFSQPASTDCTALSSNYIRPSGFLCCRPDGLELTTD